MQKSITIPKNVITDPAYYSDFTEEDWHFRFTQGQCHALAMSMNFLTKWPIYILSDIDEQSYWDQNVCACHAVVLHPNGFFLDIKGFSNREDLEDLWGWMALHLFKVSYEAFDWWDQPAEFEVSDPMAEYILANI